MFLVKIWVRFFFNMILIMINHWDPVWNYSLFYLDHFLACKHIMFFVLWTLLFRKYLKARKVIQISKSSTQIFSLSNLNTWNKIILIWQYPRYWHFFLVSPKFLTLGRHDHSSINFFFIYKQGTAFGHGKHLLLILWTFKWILVGALPERII